MIVTSVDCYHHGDESSRSIKCVKFVYSGIAGLSTKTVLLSFYFIAAYSERSVCASQRSVCASQNCGQQFFMHL